MKKLYNTVIFILCLIFFVGAALYVVGQLIFLVAGQPALIHAVAGIEKVIFPAASICGLLCYLNQYFFPGKKQQREEE